MKIIIIGGVVAGTSAAIGARKNSEETEITIYDRDVDFNHSGYATHYVVGGQVESIDQLTPRSVDWFKERHNIDVYTSHEILEIDSDKKIVYGINLKTRENFQDKYDHLIFATGSSPTVPPVFKNKKYSNVFTIKNIQGGRELQACIDKIQPKSVVVIGGGYIGLGVSEQLRKLGMSVDTLEFLNYPMPALDEELSIHIAEILKENDVNFFGGDGVVELVSEDEQLKKVITRKKKEYTGDLFILATGVRPNTELAVSIGVDLGESGAIKINNKMATNIPSVYAVGDVAEAFHMISKQPIYLPLATTAAKMGRVAGDVITDGKLRFKGILGTSVVRLFDQTIAATGLTEKAARDQNYHPVVMMNTNLSKLKFMGGEDILIKVIADQKSEEILGVQMIGKEGVARIIDVFATAMTFRANIYDLIQLDLAFTPPISTPVDPVLATGINLYQIMNQAPLITPNEMIEWMKENPAIQLIDIRSETDFKANHIKKAKNIPIDKLRETLNQLDEQKITIVYSNTGEKAYVAQEILLNKGFEKVYSLSGGINNYQIIKNHGLSNK